MNTIDYLILSATFAYTYLFFEQGDGLNYFLFAILLIVFTAVHNKDLLTQKSWWAVAIGTLITGFGVFHYGTCFTITANILSVMALSAVSFNPERSLFISAINAFYSWLLVIPGMVVDALVKKPDKVPQRGPEPRKVLLLIMPLFICFIFFLLYRSASPLFEEVSNRINLDFISADLLWFAFCGFVLMYGFFRQKMIKWLSTRDAAASNELAFISEEDHNRSLVGRLSAIHNEVFTATALFVLLNLLLLAVNATDIYYSYILQRLPNNLSLSAYLHDGTNALIVSIVFAIAIILFYFRGRINFLSGNGALRWLSFAWVGQNIFLIFSTASRNWFYISNYGLTHKRLGVYVFLALCVIGLLTAFIKVAHVKSGWYLFRRNSWVGYAALVLATFINWDAVIAGHNLRLAYEQGVKPDTLYLGSLGITATPTLLHYYNMEQQGKTSAHYFDDHLITVLSQNTTWLLQQKKTGWQSFCLIHRQAIKQWEQSENLALSCGW